MFQGWSSSSGPACSRVGWASMLNSYFRQFAGVSQLPLTCKTHSAREESMPRNLDKLTSSHQRSRLQERYMSLKQQIAVMDRRVSLSPDEQILISALKRQKLAMKDALARLP